MLGFSPLASAPLADDGVDIRSVNRVPVTGVQGTLQSPDVQPNITEKVTGVQATFESPNFTVNVSESLGSVSAISEVGLVQPSFFNVAVVAGVSATGSADTVTVNVATVPVGVVSTLVVGTPEIKPTEIVLSVQATGAVSQVQANTGTTLTTPTLTLIIGDVTRTAEVFNFETVKETYSRQRTIILPRVA
jgi:hypothetical protein